MFGLFCTSDSNMVGSGSLVVPELMFDEELMPEVALELTEHVMAFCRCFTELLGDIVFKPLNFIA